MTMATVEATCMAAAVHADDGAAGTDPQAGQGGDVEEGVWGRQVLFGL